MLTELNAQLAEEESSGHHTFSNTNFIKFYQIYFYPSSPKNLSLSGIYNESQDLNQYIKI
jgi:hypothetical protein